MPEYEITCYTRKLSKSLGFLCVLVTVGRVRGEDDNVSRAASD